MTPSSAKSDPSSISFRYKLSAWITWSMLVITVFGFVLFATGGGPENLGHMSSRAGTPLAPGVQRFWQGFFVITMVGWVVYLALLVYGEVTGKDRRVSVSDTGIVFPRFGWSNTYLSLSHREISALRVFRMWRRGRFLQVGHRAKRHRFAEVLFEGTAEFDEFCELISKKTGKAID